MARRPLYRVSTYEVAAQAGQDGDWTPRTGRVRVRTAMKKVRELERCGYDRDVSIFVERLYELEKGAVAS